MLLHNNINIEFLKKTYVFSEQNEIVMVYVIANHFVGSNSL